MLILTRRVLSIVCADSVYIDSCSVHRETEEESECEPKKFTDVVFYSLFWAFSIEFALRACN